MSGSPEVLVVGAGPTGLTIGSELLSRGIRVRVVDRADRPHPHSRALVLWPRALEILDRIGVGSAIARRSLPLRGQNYYSGGRRVARIRLDGLPGSRYDAPVSIPQQETEAVLRDRFRELGGHLEFGLRLVDLRQVPGGVEADLVGDGVQTTVRTPWLVGCDGAHSRVRDLIGVEFRGAQYSQKFVLTDGACETSLAHDEAHHFMSRTGVLTVLGLPGGLYRVVASVAADADIPDPMEFVQRCADERCPVGLRLVGEQRIGDFTVHRRMADKLRVGRVLLAGDAAHINSPVGAQGLNTGIEDAHALGWRLALVQQGLYPDAKVDEWARERHQAASIVVADTDRQTRMWLLRGWRAVARDVLLAIGEHTGVLNRYVSPRLAQLSNAYPSDEPGFARLRPGMRLPDALVRDGWVRDVLAPGNPVLLVFAVDKALDKRASARLEAARCLVDGLTAAPEVVGLHTVIVSHGAGTDVLADESGHAHAVVGARRPLAVLVRPDGVVALACRLDDARLPAKIRDLVPQRPSPVRAAPATAS